MLVLLLLALAALDPTSALSFYSQTGLLLGQETGGIIATLADVNADRLVDLLLINNDQKSVDALIMSKEGTASRMSLTKLPASEKLSLIGVIGADFNGDSRLDLALLTGAKSGAGPIKVYMAFGTSEKQPFSTPVALPKTFTDQPALIDFDSNMIADLLGETSAGKMTVFFGDKSGNFTTQEFSGSEWAHPGFSGFVDLNHDNQPDILFSSKRSGALYEVAFKNAQNTYDLSKTEVIPAIPGMSLVGRPIFEDFNMDGKFEMLVPACGDETCAKSQLWMYSYPSKKWNAVSVSLASGKDTYTFTPPSKNPLSSLIPTPLSLHSGDINGDGYPDLLVILTRSKASKTAPTPSTEAARVGLMLGSSGGTFDLQFPRGADAIYGAGLAIPFDYKETGNLGILTVEGGPSSPRLVTFMQGDGPEYYFLKVMVLNGLCGGPWNCPNERLPYGLPVPGPSFTYDTERPEGGRQVAKGAQLTQASYSALQPPYHVFGLGTFANYIESMTVYLPNPPKKDGVEVDRQKKFTFIVPKTQLVVVPYPLDEPSKTPFFAMEESLLRWKSKLFLEPFKDKKVLFVAAALLGTIIVVAITIGILQWRERREDIQERLQDAQKFHFDAM